MVVTGTTADHGGAEAGDVGEAEEEDTMMADMIVEKNGTVIEVGAVMRTTMVDGAGAGVAVGMEVDTEETDTIAGAEEGEGVDTVHHLDLRDLLNLILAMATAQTTQWGHTDYHHHHHHHHHHLFLLL